MVSIFYLSNNGDSLQCITNLIFSQFSSIYINKVVHDATDTEKIKNYCKNLLIFNTYYTVTFKTIFN